MQQEMIWLDQKLLPRASANIDILSHSLHYGSAVFEGIRLYNTVFGPRIFRLDEHIDRLLASAAIYQMALPYSKQQLIDGCWQAVAANRLQQAYIRPIAFYGAVGLGISVPKDSQASVAIAAFEWASYFHAGSTKQGVSAGVSSWQRLAANTIPTSAKAAGNYLSSQQIAMEARRHGYDEGIALDSHGFVSEGAGQNLFIVKNGVLYTPPAHAGILPGITRDTVLTLAKDLGIETRVEAIARESLYLADELFFSGTAAEITPILSIDGRVIGQGQPGALTRQVQQAFFGLFSGETVDRYGWLAAPSGALEAA